MALPAERTDLIKKKPAASQEQLINTPPGNEDPRRLLWQPHYLQHRLAPFGGGGAESVSRLFQLK